MVLEKVKQTIRKYGLIKKGDKIIIGVSGGPDSMALLYLLNSLKEELHLKLHVAHLDHGLRRDSALDARYVVDLAGKLKTPFTTAKVNMKKLAQRGSLEEICRNARFEFLFNTAKKIGAKKIALGHTLDDQAETVLMRILRGTGLSGLSGILPRRRIAGFEIVRPLIELRRRDIEVYLTRKKIKPHIDSSNFEDIYFRNKIRNQLLPLLEKSYNSNIKEVLSGMAQSVGDDYDYLSGLADNKVRQLGNKIRLDKFLKLHPALQRMLLRAHIKRLSGNTRRIGFQHIKEIEDLVFNRPANAVVDLPKGLAVVKSKTRLYFRKK